MTDIVLNGVSITELKKQRALIQKDASAFIAQGLKDVAVLMQSIKEAVEVPKDEVIDEEGIDAAAAQAKQILENIQIVSGVSGVTYYLPFYEEYGYNDEKPYSSILDNADLSSDQIDALYGLLEDMESDSRNWHSSQC